MGHRYRHATVMLDGRPILEAQSFTLGLDNRDALIETAGHYGTMKARNRNQKATLSLKGECARTGPEFDYLSAIKDGDWIMVKVVDPQMGGDYDCVIRKLSVDDDFSGERSYTIDLEGFLIS